MMKHCTIALLLTFVPGCALTQAAKEEFATPRAVLLAYRTAVQDRDWAAAEHCLATNLRHVLKDNLADRTFFDQHLTPGFKAKTLELVHVRNVNEKMMTSSLDLHSKAKPVGFAFEAQVGGNMGPSPMPFMAMQHFVREENGWKLACPRIRTREDFLKWYDRAMPKEARGQARKEEMEIAEQKFRHVP
jgi:hypothetical protein